MHDNMILNRDLENLDQIKSVKFLIMKIICASKQKNGYGGELLRNIEKNAKDKGFEFFKKEINYTPIKFPIETVVN